MSTLLEFFEGKKTYLVAFSVAVVLFLKLSNLIDEATANTVLVLLGAGGLAALRAGVSSYK